jgi:hypothetical protein
MRSKKPNEMQSILLKGFGYAPRRNLGRRRNEMKPAILKRVERVWVNPTLKEDGVMK